VPEHNHIDQYVNERMDKRVLGFAPNPAQLRTLKMQAGLRA
jgi:hypothetical protein